VPFGPRWTGQRAQPSSGLAVVQLLRIGAPSAGWPGLGDDASRDGHRASTRGLLPDDASQPSDELPLGHATSRGCLNTSGRAAMGIGLTYAVDKTLADRSRAEDDQVIVGRDRIRDTFHKPSEMLETRGLASCLTRATSAVPLRSVADMTSGAMVRRDV
jgi:hypothetical protein